MKRTAFVLDVTSDDALDVWFDVEGGVVMAFCVNYRAFIEGDWREVVRYDTSHGQLHVHEFWPHGKERILPLEATSASDYTDDLRKGMGELNANWKTYRAMMAAHE